MNALLNGIAISAEDSISLQNRGFRFGDGCFETMLVLQGSCPLLLQHEARLKKSLPILGLEWPKKLALAQQLKQLGNGETGWQRVRLWIWRAGQGVYTPEGDESHFMLAASPCAAPAIQLKEKVLLSEEVKLLPSRWSFIKSMSALHYVMAGKEKKEKGADELLLLSQQGELAEGTVANLFWKKRKRWYTPALESGCVAGVMRAWLMKAALMKGEPIFEGLAPVEELQNADKLVFSNVTGLQVVQQFRGRQFDTDVTELWSLMPEEYRRP